MSVNSHAVYEMSPATVASTVSRLRLFAWSLRKELWEHRAIYRAVLFVAGFVIVGLIYSAFRLPGKIEYLATLSTSERLAAYDLPYSAAAMILMATMVLVGCFYCIETLYGERRDRSLLFWKSMPVSDAIAVLAKFAIPMIALPTFALCMAILSQLVMLIASTLMVYANDLSVSALWAQLPISTMPIGLAYFVLAISLWFAPVYAWFMFVSVWAKRATLVWAAAPVVALIAIEQLTLNTSIVTQTIKSRLVGVASASFTANADSSGRDSYPDLVPDPGKFFASPELWIGLLIAAALLIATIRMRRLRDPI